MSALPPEADMCSATRDVRFGPKADIGEQAPKLVFHGPCYKPFNASAMALSRLGWRSSRPPREDAIAPPRRRARAGVQGNLPWNAATTGHYLRPILSRSLGDSYMGTRSAQGTFVANLPV